VKFQFSAAQIFEKEKRAHKSAFGSFSALANLQFFLSIIKNFSPLRTVSNFPRRSLPLMAARIFGFPAAQIFEKEKRAR
jgi:hypothetical protein